MTVTDDGSGTGERALTEFGGPLTAAGIRPAAAADDHRAGRLPGARLAGRCPRAPGPHPMLLVVHGGPHAAYTPALFDEAQVYAGAGYAVVMGNPRGSAGYGQAHGRSVVGALGTVDVDDVLALLDAALARPDCDAARVGVMGGSYGGFMTSWLCSHAPDRFTAAISERAVNAWDSFAGSSDIGYYFARAYVGADRDTQWRASPLAYADGDRRADADHPLRARLAVPGRAGPAAVRRAQAARRRGGDAAVPRRGARAVPIRPAGASAATLRRDPGLVGSATCRWRRLLRRVG